MYPRTEIKTETLSYDVEKVSYRLTLFSGAEFINTITGKIGGEHVVYVESATSIFNKMFLERSILYRNTNMLELTPGSFYNQEAIQKVEIISTLPHRVDVIKVTATTYCGEDEISTKDKYIFPNEV